MTDRSDPYAPVRGDRVVITDGQFVGQRGTVTRRNGNRMSVVLHGERTRAVRTADGQWWAVPPDRMLPITPVHPLMRFVARRT